MISYLGNLLQIFSILCSSIVIITALRSIRYHPRISVIFFYLSSVSTLLAFLLLVYGFIISDFSIQNIFLNSSLLKPLKFKIAASWASHEGSILLWLCLLQTVGFVYVARFNSASIQLYNISVLSLIQILFGSFIYFTSNPFDSLSFTPSQGLGLNPMLQDIALIIHPPILYLGYVCYVIPFSSACSMLLRAKIELNELKIIRIFTSVGILLVTFGVALGSWWAYRELGWGGFWFFDPVENISLLPWLAGIALYHSIVAMIKSGEMRNWTIILSIITFLLVIFSTFLVRSGMIISIHSFASSPSRAIYMLSIFAIIALSSLILLVRKSPYLQQQGIVIQKNYYNPYIIWGNLCFVGALVILLSATIYPVIYSVISGQSINIDEKFFVNNFIIFAIPILILAAIVQENGSRQKNILILVLSLIITLISSYKLKYSLISASIMASSIFLIVQSIAILVMQRILSTNGKINFAMILGHLGFGLLALTITLNVLLQKEIDFIGKVGDKISVEGFEVTLRSVRVSSAQNYYRQIAEFWIQDKKNNITILKPENRFYIIEQRLSQESNIYSYLLYDLYAVLNQIDNNIIHGKIYYRPMMSFIWLSILVILGGFLISIFQRVLVNKE